MKTLKYIWNNRQEIIGIIILISMAICSMILTEELIKLL